MAERTKLTKAAVEAAQVAPGASELWLWDSECPGLFLRVYAGGRRVYGLTYGTGARGGTRRVAIGPHGAPWNPETARAKARELLHAVDDGRDPAAEHARARETPSLAAFAIRYVREHGIARKRLSTVRQDVENLGRILFRGDDDGRKLGKEFRRNLWAEVRRTHPDAPTDTMAVGMPRDSQAVQLGGGLSELGRRRVDLISAADIDREHRRLRSTPTAANRVVALLRHLMVYAERAHLRPANSNPCSHVERYRENRRERFLSAEELSRLGAALAEADDAHERQADDAMSPFAVAAIRLLLFTGARRAEILTLKWEYVNLPGETIAVPRPKEGAPKLVRLNKAAIKVLKAVPRVEGNPYVIVGGKVGEHLHDLERPWRRIRAAAILPNVRLHDLRHGFASVAVGSGASLPIIGALLGHRQASTTSRYAHLSADPLRAVAETVGKALDAALKVRPARRRKAATR